MKPVLVVLVTYKRLNFLKDTLDSLMPTLPVGSHFIIVNNDKEQDTWDYLNQFARDHWPHVALIFRNNDGWGTAMNDAFKSFPEWGNFEYVLESNNDVAYDADWCAKAQAMMEAHPEIGILGLNKHPNHGVRSTHGDGLVIKDDMPATAWFFRSRDLAQFLPFPEKGATNTRGGNGEDSDMVAKVHAAGKWVCGLKDDLAHHTDEYNADLGKVNPAYL